MSEQRALSEEEITEATGARVAAGDSYEVQLDGAWVSVDHSSYERVKEIQDSCA